MFKFKWETLIKDGLTFAVDCTISGRNTIQLNHSGEQTVTVHPADAKTWRPINLRWIRFTKVAD